MAFIFSGRIWKKFKNKTKSSQSFFVKFGGVIISPRFWNILPPLEIDRTDIHYVSSYVTPFFILLKKSKILNRVTNLQPYVKELKSLSNKKNLLKEVWSQHLKKNLVCVQLIWLECMNDFLDQTLFTSQLFLYNFWKDSPPMIYLPIYFLTSFKNFFCCKFFEIFISKNNDFSDFFILRFLPLPNQSNKNFLN